MSLNSKLCENSSLKCRDCSLIQNLKNLNSSKIFRREITFSLKIIEKPHRRSYLNKNFYPDSHWFSSTF